jgi:DNA repair protein
MGGFIPEDDQEAAQITSPTSVGARNHACRSQSTSEPLRARRPLRLTVPDSLDSQGSGPQRCGWCDTGIPCDDLARAFGIRVCSSCRKELQLVSKSTAKQQYLLTETDLKPLKSLERKNPRQKDWNAMKLYLESEVRDISYKKYGGQSGLEEEARRRVSKKLEVRILERERKVRDEAKRVRRVKEIREEIHGKDGIENEYHVDGDDEEII